MSRIRASTSRELPRNMKLGMYKDQKKTMNPLQLNAIYETSNEEAKEELEGESVKVVTSEAMRTSRVTMTTNPLHSSYQKQLQE